MEAFWLLKMLPIVVIAAAKAAKCNLAGTRIGVRSKSQVSVRVVVADGY